MSEEKITYKTIRKPFWVITEEWLNKTGRDGWIMCGKRDFNEYIFYRKIN